MYSQQIENLIDLALADGELTEKEKHILFKKAEAEGIDLDEFEMVLDAKLFEKKQIIKKQLAPTLTINAAPKSDKLGDIKKCPNCGAITQSFSTKCSDCGHEFRNIDASINITNFFDKLDELESTRNDNLFEKKNEFDYSFFNLIKLYMFWWLYLIKFFVNKSKPAKWSITDARKEEMILNFPVPNSREEIIEFITLSISKIQILSFYKRFSDEGKYISKWNLIWKKKAEQVFIKAKLSMLDDKSTILLIEQLLVDAKVLNTKK